MNIGKNIDLGQCALAQTALKVPDNEMYMIKTMSKHGTVLSILGKGMCPQGVVNATEKELYLEGDPELELLQLSPVSDL